MQQQCTVGGEGLKNRYIETSGVGPCVVFTLYDIKRKIGLMAHLHESTDADTVLSKLLKIFGNTSNIEARVVGGEQPSNSLFEKLVINLRSRNIRVIEMQEVSGNSRFIFDAIEGILYGGQSQNRERLDFSSVNLMDSDVTLVS